ncbi:hypothetical protein Droror1_Dr00022632 [Drosera rotundifolia]
MLGEEALLPDEKLAIEGESKIDGDTVVGDGRPGGGNVRIYELVWFIEAISGSSPNKSNGHSPPHPHVWIITKGKTIQLHKQRCCGPYD